MSGRINHHRRFIGIVGNDIAVHVEQVAVFKGDGIPAVALDGLHKIQIDGTSRRPDPFAGITLLLGIARSHVPRHQVAEARVFFFQIIIAFIFRDVVGRALIS